MIISYPYIKPCRHVFSAAEVHGTAVACADCMAWVLQTCIRQTKALKRVSSNTIPWIPCVAVAHDCQPGVIGCVRAFTSPSLTLCLCSWATMQAAPRHDQPSMGSAPLAGATLTIMLLTLVTIMLLTLVTIMLLTLVTLCDPQALPEP